MKGNRVICAIQIVLFLGICHKPANIQDICKGIRMPKSYVSPVLDLLQKAHVLAITDSYSYRLHEQVDHLTLTDITAAVEKTMEREDICYELKDIGISR